MVGGGSLRKQSIHPRGTAQISPAECALADRPAGTPGAECSWSLAETGGSAPPLPPACDAAHSCRWPANAQSNQKRETIERELRTFIVSRSIEAKLKSWFFYSYFWGRSKMLIRLEVEHCTCSSPEERVDIGCRSSCQQTDMRI